MLTRGQVRGKCVHFSIQQINGRPDIEYLMIDNHDYGDYHYMLYFVTMPKDVFLAML